MLPENQCMEKNIDIIEDEIKVVLPKNPVELNEHILALQDKLFKMRTNAKEAKEVIVEIDECFGEYNKLVGYKAFVSHFTRNMLYE